jgi:PAS domain S-box-containing protein
VYAQPILVLLVEDNPGDARLVREMLRNSSDVVIHHVDRLATGLEYISTRQVDVVLLDLGLPDSDGLETLRVFIESSPDSPPVVVLTGQDDEAIGVQAVSEGAQDYLIKNNVTGAVINRVLHYAIERRRIVVKLQQSDMLYRSLSENSPDLIAQFDRQCRHLYVNPSAAGAGRYIPEEYIGKSLTEVGVPEQEAEKWEKHIRAAFDTGRIVDVEDTFETSNGLRYFNTKFVPDAASDGSIYSVQSIARDITARKRSEEQERLSARVLELLNLSETAETTIHSILKLIKTSTGLEAVGIRLREGDDFPYVETNGFPDHFVEKELYLCERDAAGAIVLDAQGNPILECMCGNVLCGRTDAKQPFFTEVGSFWTNGTTELLATTSESERQTRTRNRCNGEGYESVALIPLRSGAEVIGLLQLNDRRYNQFDLPMIHFFEGLGASVGIAIARKRATEELSRLSARHEAILSEIPDIIMEVNANKVYTWANAVGLDFFGEDVIGRETAGYFVGEQETYLNVQPLLKGESATFYVESWQRRKDGQKRLLGWWCRALTDDEGVVLGVLSTARDITEPRLAEEARRESEEKYHTLIENANESILIAQDGSFVFVNGKTASMLGVPVQELIGRSFIDFIHPDDRSEVADRQLRCITGETVEQNSDFRAISADGQITWVQLGTVPIQWKGKAATLNFLTDVTQRKRMSAEREKLQTQLMQAQKMESIGRLAGGVAHDHNNMLSVILGYTELSMRGMNPSDPLYDNLQEIQKAAIRSTEVTQQLLAFARKQTVAPRMIDLNSAVEGMLKMLRQLIGEDVELTWNPGTGVWPVRMDPIQVDQILVNLCINARDAIYSVGRISIETGNITFDEAHRCNQAENLFGDYSILTVSDNGEGMDKEIMAMIFEPYFTTKEIGKGTGLGLATVYGIVQQNAGMITVYSEQGMGTTFRIYLPRHTSKTQKIPREISASPSMRGQETILLVEDEQAILQLTATILEDQGYRVLSALTPSAAIRLASEYSGEIHLLMTDMVMPGMCGLDLSKKLTSTHPGIRLLFCSGYTADVIAHQGVLDEGMHFIQKPYSIKNLAAKVRETLDGA